MGLGAGRLMGGSEGCGNGCGGFLGILEEVYFLRWWKFWNLVREELEGWRIWKGIDEGLWWMD